MSTSGINPIERLSFNLTAAKSTNALPFAAEFVCVLAADEEFDVYLNKATQSFPLDVNGFFRMPLDAAGKQTQFFHIEFRRKTGAVVADNEIRVVIGSGDYETNAFVLNTSVDIAADNTIRQTPASEIVAVADKAPVATGGANATQLAAANADRRCATVDNTGTVPLRIAGTEADAIAGRGFYLNPSASKEIYSTSALWAAGVGGVGACAITEENW